MNLLVRTLVTLAGIPLLVYMFFGPRVLFYILFSLISILSVFELEQILKRKTRISGTLLSIVLIVATYAAIYSTGFTYFQVILIATAYVFFFQMLFSGAKDQYMENAFYLAIMTYVFIFPLFLLRLREFKLGSHLVLFLFITIWSVDILAYIGGCSIRGPKLAPTISPKKTIAGFVSGIVGALITCSVYCLMPFGKETMLKVLSPGQLVFTSIVLSVIAQLGDLFESRLKRIYEIKDSSNIIPGHGGILDRFDSVLFTAPLYYLIICSFSGGF